MICKKEHRYYSQYNIMICLLIKEEKEDIGARDVLTKEVMKMV